MKDIIMKLNERIKFHEKELSYIIPTTREMFMHEGAIRELKTLIEYLEQNYDTLP